MKGFFVNVQLLLKITTHWENSEQNKEYYVHELHEISLSQGMYYSYFFHFYFGVRNNSTVSIVSNSSIVASISSVSSASIVCSGKLLL